MVTQFLTCIRQQCGLIKHPTTKITLAWDNADTKIEMIITSGNVFINDDKNVLLKMLKMGVIIKVLPC